LAKESQAGGLAMAEEKFSDNLMRLLVAELHFSNCLAASQHLFDKPYFSLSAVEKGMVDQTVVGHVGGNYQAITPEFLAAQKAQQPMGFVNPASAQSAG
jgi:hypothetical protein